MYYISVRGVQNIVSAELLTQYRIKRRELKEFMSSSMHSHLRNGLASTNDSARIWRILRKEGLTVDKNHLSNNRFTAHELNSFYSAVACAHPRCLSSSLDLIVAPIQDIGDCTLSSRKITSAEFYETARMLSSKSKGQIPDWLSWKHLKSLLLPLLLFLVKIFNCLISTKIYSDLQKTSLHYPTK